MHPCLLQLPTAPGAAQPLAWCTAGYGNTSRCDPPVKVQGHNADFSKETKPSSAFLRLGLPRLRRFGEVYDGIQQAGMQDSLL